MYDKNKVILTDCDGVCLDWEFGFHTWMGTKGYTPEKQNLYSVATQYGLHQEDAKVLVEQFNSSASMGFLPPLRDAQYYMKLIAEELGYRFVAVTSLSADESAQKLRTCNLNKLFGDGTFVEFHYLDCGADKDEILTELANKYEGSMWVEDKYKNAEVGRDLGYETFLMEHGHSLDYWGKNITVVKNWKEIYEHVKAR